MKKLKTLLKAPLLTSSGYGRHSKEIFEALYHDPLFDVYVESLNWGACSFLTEDSEYKRNVRSCIDKLMVEKHQNNNQNPHFDLFVHVTIPNEFERLGDFNVGVTAGIETSHVSPVWVNKSNEMDLVIVPSEHSKNTLINTIVEWKNQQTGETGTLKTHKPVVVVSEGVDTSVFGPTPEGTDFSVFDFEPDFNFLCVGQWGKGGFGEDRKNIALTVKYFIEAFLGRKDVGLILKVNMARNSAADYEQVLNRLSEIKSNYKSAECPPIYLLHGNLTDKEMNLLYNHPKVSAMLSLAHGEGFGRPLLEASVCGLPVMATNWSGHVDFLNKGKFIAFDYDLKEVPDSAVWDDVIIKGSAWAEVREEDVKRKMKKIVQAPSMPLQWARELSAVLREELNLKKVQTKFIDTIKQSMLKNETVVSKNPVEYLMSYVDTPESYNVIYTMPMSTGDVFISTAVIDGLIKQCPPDTKIYFATQPHYKDLLKNNPNIHCVIDYKDWMINLDILEEVFDLALTPNVATQYTFSNWVRRGQGRLLAEEFANHCHTELGDYFIDTEEVSGLPEFYMTLHTTSGKGQWEGRKYVDWPELLSNIKRLYPMMSVVQVGGADEEMVPGVDFSLCGKTNYQQLAYVMKNSKLHVGPDSFQVHLAAAFNTPVVGLYGCSMASATGPWVRDKKAAKFILLQSERRSGCLQKACYKNRCAKNPHNPAGPINEISPREIFNSCELLLKMYEE